MDEGTNEATHNLVLNMAKIRKSPEDVTYKA
jgi:hypothetical protein